MTRRRPDLRLAAARYTAGQQAADDGRAGRHSSEQHRDQEPGADPGRPTADARAQYVEVVLQQAMRRGDFDDLPGAGTPLPAVDSVRDPDWWIRRKIEREGLTGLGPPALTLRTEDARLEDRLDALHVEDRVRELLDDFNGRVREARRQLLGGPPVITRPRDVEAEVAAWRRRAEQRRADAVRAAEEQRVRDAAALAAMTWRERCRARRERRR